MNGEVECNDARTKNTQKNAFFVRTEKSMKLQEVGCEIKLCNTSRLKHIKSEQHEQGWLMFVLRSLACESAKIAR